MSWSRFNALVAVCLIATAPVLINCSSVTKYIPSSSSSSNPVYKVGNPYQIDGTWYYPKEDYDYEEIGVASWYGPDFHNGITANGEVYDMHLMTAAHRTLPLPSIVRVTNLENGKEVVLRVNDRGPFVNNRIIDVSKLAAQKLDFHNSGTTRVKVDILPEESKELKEAMLAGDIEATYSYTSESTRPEKKEKIMAMNEPVPEMPVISSTTSSQSNINSLTPQPIVQDKASSYAAHDGKLYVQIAAFSSKPKAEELADTVSRYGKVRIVTASVGGANIYRVRIGEFKSGKQALDLLDKMRKLGYKDARVVEEVMVTKGW